MNEATPHQEGPPWRIIRRFSTFQGADAERNKLNEEENLQVKIQWMRKSGSFAVKTRIDPSLALEALLKEKRELKKRRKLKLQKKRRKK
tara:strand:+ start:1246 stop:1512 length:267 start_codon:yes stop_codon:yes gene_type:complete